MNIREELNKLDQDTFNQYDLFNLYSSISVDKELKEQIIGLIKESKCEELCNLLSEAYEKQTGVALTEKKPSKKSAFNKDELYQTIYNSVLDALTSNLGFPADDVKDYFFVDLEDIDDRLRVEVRAELGYNGMQKLAEVLDPIIQKYDEYSYFDFDEPGIMSAYLDNNSTNESLTETYENLPEIEDKVQGVTDQVTAKAVKDHEKKMKNIRKGLKDADAEIKDEPFTSGENQPKPDKPVVPDLIKEGYSDEEIYNFNKTTFHCPSCHGTHGGLKDEKEHIWKCFDCGTEFVDFDITPSPYPFESLKEGTNKEIDAVQYAYGFNKKQARDYLKKVDDNTKKELVKGFESNAKKSALNDSLKEGAFDRFKKSFNRFRLNERDKYYRIAMNAAEDVIKKYNFSAEPKYVGYSYDRVNRYVPEGKEVRSYRVIIKLDNKEDYEKAKEIPFQTNPAPFELKEEDFGKPFVERSTYDLIVVDVFALVDQDWSDKDREKTNKIYNKIYKNESLKESETVDTGHYDLWDEKPYTKKQLLYELNSDKMLEKSKGSFQVGHPDERDLCAEILSDAGYEYEISGDGPWFHFEYWKEENESLKEDIDDENTYSAEEYDRVYNIVCDIAVETGNTPIDQLEEDITERILSDNGEGLSEEEIRELTLQFFEDELVDIDESLKEDYGWEIPADKVWDAYDELVEIMGAEGLLLSLAKAMSTEELADNLAYICRMNDLEISSLKDSPERNESLKESEAGLKDIPENPTLKQFREWDWDSEDTKRNTQLMKNAIQKGDPKVRQEALHTLIDAIVEGFPEKGDPWANAYWEVVFEVLTQAKECGVLSEVLKEVKNILEVDIFDKTPSNAVNPETGEVLSNYLKAYYMSKGRSVPQRLEGINEDLPYVPGNEDATIILSDIEWDLDGEDNQPDLPKDLEIDFHEVYEDGNDYLFDDEFDKLQKYLEEIYGFAIKDFSIEIKKK